MATEADVVKYIAKFKHDPYGFVLAAFPWGKGALKNYEGPDEWQKAVLCAVGQGIISMSTAIKIAVSSGHGIGKSALVAWLILWAMATSTDTRGVVTANTNNQLMYKTWPELTKWAKLFILPGMFTVTATSIYSSQKKHEKTWRIDAIPWSKDNPEAFAGLHNHGRRILVIFDEASAIDNSIWEVTEGAMTDAGTEIIWCCFGNPTRPNGRFFECFEKQNIWKCWKIDSRTVKVSNKELLKQWAEEWGEDSDFFRIRVRGEFPRAGENQLISRELAEEALKRRLTKAQYDFAPVIIGVDPAWTGDDMLAIVVRQGLYSKVLEVIPKNDNDMDIARKVARYDDEYSASAVFIDMGYGTGIYSAGKDMGRSSWRLVQFAGKAGSEEYANKRAEMWFEMKRWLQDGGCIDSKALADELTSVEAFINRGGKHQLESKDTMRKRGISSPNIADALSLTFAFPVQVGRSARLKGLRESNKLRKWGAM